MIDQLFVVLDQVDEFFWYYVGVPALLIIGMYLSLKSGFFQIRQFSKILKIFKSFTKQKDDTKVRGIAPINAFFASVGGAIGVGNLVSVCVSIQIGGPGAVFWMWVAALMGMLVKYSEIYLGVKFRIQNNENSYTGGPMIFLRHVPHGKFFAKLATVLMCLYGIEIYIFRVVTHSISQGWNIDPLLVIPTLLILVLIAGRGGVRVVGKICSYVIPFFLAAYLSAGIWVLLQNASFIPGILYSIFVHAFTPHAALGAFAGSSMFLAMSHGVRRACYTGDIGVGYASVMHAETKESVPARQASLGVIDIFLDSFVVCTMSMLLVLVSGMWHKPIDPVFMISETLSRYFPYVDLIWPLFIFLLGYTTIIAFFAAGRRSATLLSSKYGANVYTVAAAVTLLMFSFLGTQNQCLAMMSLVGVLLLVCNLYALFYLRDEISFDLSKHV
ncbi:sodium:alanine symporter family protein [Candidatus Babeliales bacterium]|nr:sodium:alanine symporter family protein [Candidatus Babeliales bacterium]